MTPEFGAEIDGVLAEMNGHHAQIDERYVRLVRQSAQRHRRRSRQRKRHLRI